MLAARRFVSLHAAALAKAGFPLSNVRRICCASSGSVVDLVTADHAFLNVHKIGADSDNKR